MIDNHAFNYIIKIKLENKEDREKKQIITSPNDCWFNHQRWGIRFYFMLEARFILFLASLNQLKWSVFDASNKKNWIYIKNHPIAVVVLDAHFLSKQWFHWNLLSSFSES